jgi:hypothetical protein
MVPLNMPRIRRMQVPSRSSAPTPTRTPPKSLATSACSVHRMHMPCRPPVIATAASPPDCLLALRASFRRAGAHAGKRVWGLRCDLSLSYRHLPSSTFIPCEAAAGYAVRGDVAQAPRRHRRPLPRLHPRCGFTPAHLHQLIYTSSFTPAHLHQFLHTTFFTPSPYIRCHQLLHTSSFAPPPSHHLTQPRSFTRAPSNQLHHTSFF